MLKEATIYRVAGLPSLHEFLAASLAAETFAPTGRTQQKSTGWEPPRAAHGAMVESIDGHWIARFTTEVRTVGTELINAQAAGTAVASTLAQIAALPRNDGSAKSLGLKVSAAELLERLRTVSATPLPQPLEYLIGDVARRHGVTRVGIASSYLRCDDEATLAELLASPSCRRVGVRLLDMRGRHEQLELFAP